MFPYVYASANPTKDPKEVSDLIVAQCPIQVLQLWYYSLLPRSPIERQHPGDLHGTPYKFPTSGPVFLSLVIAALERYYNLSPRLNTKTQEEQEKELVQFMETHNIIKRK